MTEYRFVDRLPDLIHPADYADDPDGRRIRLRIRRTENGIEILGDAVRPDILEKLLEKLGAEVVEQMLCG